MKNENEHDSVVEDSVKWCEESYLHLNVTNTKDMVIDLREKKHLSHTH